MNISVSKREGGKRIDETVKVTVEDVLHQFNTQSLSWDQRTHYHVTVTNHKDQCIDVKVVRQLDIYRSTISSSEKKFIPYVIPNLPVSLFLYILRNSSRCYVL